jgi:REP element-mobilizing transposase RayT
MLPAEESPRIRRVEFELRATGVKPDQQKNRLHSGIHTRGYLPHVKREGVRYFVTFRLADSLPKEVLLTIKAKQAMRLAALNAKRGGQAEHTACRIESIEEIERDYFRELEAYLDRGTGQCWLRRPDIAGLVSGALKFFDGERYALRAWVVMPNHVHVVFWPVPDQTVSGIVHSWKRFIGREANKILHLTGHAFWQPEPFDHWIRNDVEFARCCSYVIHNPVKARLCRRAEEWPWSSAWNGSATQPQAAAQTP